ncbi:MAG: exodeoxyribonuclease VII large subunit [Bradymonadia bacterium]
MTEQGITSVSELTEQIKSVLESRFISIRLQGEIGHINAHRSGHVYCSLKDESARIDAVVWRSTVVRLAYRPEPGAQVVVTGRLSVYAPHGAYKLVITSIEPAGLGRLQALFEETKRRLEAEGYFDPEKKQQLPLVPRGVGVITSPTGAARRDIESVLHRRSPQIPIYLYPANVQGPSAVGDLIAGLKALEAHPNVDVIIIGRGGGSLEDLWSFNDRDLAHAIFTCSVPVVSAVGHETDTTISDMVADKRAATPSAAAELVVPIRDDLLFTLTDLTDRFNRAMKHLLVQRSQHLNREMHLLRRGVALHGKRLVLGRLMQKQEHLLRQRVARERESVKRLDTRLARCNPNARLVEQRRRLLSLHDQLRRIVEERVYRQRLRFQRLVERLDVLSPLSVLARGYSLTTLHQQVVMGIEQVSRGDEINIRVQDGVIQAEVLSTTAQDER